MPAPTRPAPPPLEVDTARVVLAGMVAWALALLVVLVLGDRLDRVWTWTCLCGLGLAVVGLAVMRWQGRLGSLPFRRPRSTSNGRATGS